MDHSCNELKQLNQATFEAEAQKNVGDEAWDQFLQRVLAHDFVIRRSNSALANQNRAEMLDWIRNHPAGERTLIAEEMKAWCNETLGVVTCPVTMMRDDNNLHRYQNIKVFTKGANGAWQCVYWQVTEAPTA